MQLLDLSNLQVSLVDDEDFERVSRFKWTAQRSRSTFYAVRHVYLPDGRRTHQGLHTFLMNPPPGFVVDHKNGDGRINTRNNLRLATLAQNAANRAKFSGGSSNFKGVTLPRRTGKWGARIRQGDKISWLGVFESELDAALAYDVAAREKYGEFALCNFHGGPA